MNRYLVRDLFGIQGLDIAWYGVIIVLGALLGLLLACARAKKDGLKSDVIADFIVLALPLALVGARLFYVLIHWQDMYRGTGFLNIIAIWHGGSAIYGALIFGLLTAIAFCAYHRFPFLWLTDLLMPSLALGQAVGRWGNFVNQEAFGRLISDPSLQFFPYGVFIERLGEWHQATFFYESVWDLLLVLVLLYISRRAKTKGLMLPCYFIGYGLGRFWIEMLRTDQQFLFGLPISVLISALLIVVGVLMIVFLVRKKYRFPAYHGKYRQ